MDRQLNAAAAAAAVLKAAHLGVGGQEDRGERLHERQVYHRDLAGNQYTRR